MLAVERQTMFSSQCGARSGGGGGRRTVVSCGVTSGEFVSVQLLVGYEVGEIPVGLTVEKSSICSTLFSVEGVSG